MQIGKWKITNRDLIWFIICLGLALCFFIGLFLFDKASASSVLSGASTAVSIVLSVVAILYTMIEGANSSQMNQDTKSKLERIELQLRDATEKLGELKALDRRIKHLVPKIDMAVQKIEQSSQQGAEIGIDEDIKKNLEYLMSYIEEDIDD